MKKQGQGQQKGRLAKADIRDAGTQSKVSQRRRERGRQRKQQIAIRAALFTLCMLFIILSAAVLLRVLQTRKGARDGPGTGRALGADGKIPRPELDVDLLSVNEYSRPGIALEKISGIVIHYTANPGTGAAANRNYFEGLKDSHITKASSHFVIGLEGEIVQCIPSSEIAYASNGRNYDTLSIECCIQDETGKFSKPTYDAAVHLSAWLVEHFGLGTKDIIRHYDVTGKPCPKYFVDYPAAWDQFLDDVGAYLASYGVS